MDSKDELARELQELELSLLNIDAHASGRMFDLLADDFLEFSSSGLLHTKSDVISSLQAELPAALSTDNFKVRQLSPNAALVTYHACRHTEPPIHSLRSSIWHRGPKGWQMLFHQGTTTQKHS